MTILVTGFNGKVGYEVANKLKEKRVAFKCGVRDVEKAVNNYSDEFEFTALDFSKAETFDKVLDGIDKIFLMYPPGDVIHFEEFLDAASKKGIQHIVYLSVKDVQFLPFIHHFKNEKLIQKKQLAFTFLRAGYFMQNLNDFLSGEINKNNRIFVPAGKGKTSFVDVRDIAEIAASSLLDSANHHNKKYVITGKEAIDFYQVAEIMSEVLKRKIVYANPPVKVFKEYMTSSGADPAFMNVVIGIHIPTKLGLAKGITNDFEKITGQKPGTIRQYIEDFSENWN
jgi:uncharacterized protein YbjT (DUF2867 family)